MCFPNALPIELILCSFFLLHKFSHFTYAGVMGCGAAEAIGLGFVCFVVINPRVLSANRVDFGLFFVS